MSGDKQPVALTPEEQAAQDRDCDLAKRQHKWHWLWLGDEWTDNVQCATCGHIRHQSRSGERGVTA